MTRIGMGIVGVGFVGPHHIDAVRRLGYVDVVAVADMNEALAREKANQLHVPKAYGSYEALIADPDIQVVHNATPNYLHYPVNVAAIAKGKHVVCDKPLAVTAAEAKKLVELATKAGIVHAVTFGYRGNPLVQQARVTVAARGFRPPDVHARALRAGLAAEGHGLLVAPRTRQERRSRRRSATSDRTGATSRSTSAACASRTCSATSRRSFPSERSRRARARRFRRAAGTTSYELVDIKVEDLASVLLRFDNGAKGAFSVGAGLRRPQERPRVRAVRVRQVDALAAGGSERALDRQPRHGQRGSAEGSVPARAGGRGPSPTCRAATRKGGRTRTEM